MYILGINAYHGNASAAIVADGRLIAAVEEERFNRVKYAAGFPSAAIRYCLDAAGVTLSEVDHIAIPRNPWARLGTKLLYALRMPSFARERAKVMARFVGIPEALAQAFEIAPEKIRASEALKPGGNPAEAIKEISRLRAKEVMCFGHAPHLDQMIYELAGARGAFTSLKKAGVACFEHAASHGRWDLQWLLTPKILRQLAE